VERRIPAAKKSREEPAVPALLDERAPEHTRCVEDEAQRIEVDEERRDGLARLY